MFERFWRKKTYPALTPIEAETKFIMGRLLKFSDKDRREILAGVLFHSLEAPSHIQKYPKKKVL